ncbi:maltose acetyltransferase domain-containing protein [Turicibacter bilis]|nr:maltose acetyltransferase domain-containing protein [Turicibacter bilis]
MHHQRLYYCNHNELMSEQEKCLDRLYEFNQTHSTKMKKRRQML